MNKPESVSEETIFSAALHRAPAERASFLDAACAGQPALRARIEELLKAQPELGEFMEAPPDPDTFTITEDMGSALDSMEKEGSRIGRYKLLQKIGEGGCGIVYMAEQEEPVKRRVALKVIKLGMDTKSVIARFEAERQALAMMDHPNIAKVLDGGATETGRPYFVMELVRGTKITEFCDQNRLPTTERLDLFIQVCQAVQHAHQKGIIHRDLKPSNILVTVQTPGSPGVPIIIDFGIAKATQGRLTDQTLFTAFEQFLGTPAYMSPEQAMLTALDIDTRSDIYSLGVLLYELLTGRTPFDGRELLAAGFEEMRRTIREKEPLRPSTRLSTLLAGEQTSTASYRQTDAPKLVHLVRGDLDWIVMKCLEKDRVRRYETANGLAADIQRHLSNEPVLARPPSRLYELEKTVRRHKAGFAATVAVMLALAASVVLTTREAARARRAEFQTRRTAYIADMDLANRAINEEDLGAARRLLRRYLPRPDEVDLRNWEWRHLAQRSDGDAHFPLIAHFAQVRRLCFLDDNTLLSVAPADWRMVLWNLKERRPSSIITNHNFGGESGASDVSVAAPRRNVLFSRSQWTRATDIRAIDLLSGQDHGLRQANRTRLEPDAPIRSLDLSPDQNLLAVAFGNQVAIWDLDRMAWSQPFATVSGAATQGLFSPDGRVLVVADENGHLAFWNWAERTAVDILTNAPGTIGALRFSRDGRWLVNPGGASSTQIWSAKDRVLIAELQDSVYAERAIFSPDGQWLALAGGDSTIRLWQTSNWRKRRTLRAHTESITAMDFSPQGKYLATGARNGEVKLWSLDDVPSGSDRVSFSPSAGFELAGDGSAFGRIAEREQSNGVASPLAAELWTSMPLQRIATVALPAGVPASAVILPGGGGAVFGGNDGSIRIVGPSMGQEIVLTNVEQLELYLMDASIDGSTLATKSLDYSKNATVRIWRLPTLEPVGALPHAQNVHGFKLSHDGNWLAGFTGPGDMGVWEIPSMRGPPMWRAIEAMQSIAACAFSPDNRWLAAATYSGSAFLWELATHRRVELPRALTHYTSLSFSIDGSRLAAGSEGESKLFDAASGQTILSFKQRGMKLAFARDGERLLAVHREGAFVLHAPPFERLQFDWLHEQSSDTPSPYRGPNHNYVRPDRPGTNAQR